MPSTSSSGHSSTPFAQLFPTRCHPSACLVRSRTFPFSPPPPPSLPAPPFSSLPSSPPPFPTLPPRPPSSSLSCPHPSPPRSPNSSSPARPRFLSSQPERPGSRAHSCLGHPWLLCAHRPRHSDSHAWGSGSARSCPRDLVAGRPAMRRDP